MSSGQPGDIVCVIPCAGQATRMRPLSYHRPKQLLPVCNRPVIDYILEAVGEAGITRVCLVTNPDSFSLQSHVRRHWAGRLDLHWREQKQARGIADAVTKAADFVGDDPVVVYLGDALYGDGIGSFVELFRKRPDCGLLRLKQVAEPSNYGIVWLDGVDQVRGTSELAIRRVKEKPKIEDEPEYSDWGITGLYAFPPGFIPVAQAVAPGRDGELQITDAIAAFLFDAQGRPRVYGERYDGPWTDAGRPPVFLQANADELIRLLSDPSEVARRDLGVVEGRVVRGPGSHVAADCAIDGDLIVGRGCGLEGVTIQGACAINDGAVVRESTVGNSIIDADAVVEGMGGGVTDCIIGVGARLKGAGAASSLERAVVGDGDRVYYY